jgi:hypothetical protein
VNGLWLRAAGTRRQYAPRRLVDASGRPLNFTVRGHPAAVPRSHDIEPDGPLTLQQQAVADPLSPDFVASRRGFAVSRPHHVEKVAMLVGLTMMDPALEVPVHRHRCGTGHAGSATPGQGAPDDLRTLPDWAIEPAAPVIKTARGPLDPDTWLQLCKQAQLRRPGRPGRASNSVSESCPQN